MRPKHRLEEFEFDLLSYFESVRKHTDELCEPLEKEDFIPQPVEDVSPVRWNIAHTTWFFEEMILKKYVDGYNEFDPSFNFLFNSYYNTVGERTIRAERGHLSRPTVDSVFEYRAHVDQAMSDLIRSGPNDDVADLVVLGLNHEQQHQELLLTDLKYTLSVNPLFPVYREGFAPEETSQTSAGDDVSIKAGKYEIGFSGEGFCFDNQLARHNVWLDDFSISSSLVTNRQYLDFIEDGGYEDHRLWHAEGWDWVDRESIAAPLYWRKIGSDWKCFTLSGLRELSLDAPVCHVSYYEAAAYAEWANRRLPTEFEWESAAEKFEWGLRWEWTQSAYSPYPGFRVAEGAVGEYNGKFMVNQMVLRGGSVATPPGHSRITYRNFFHPHLRWQFTGIRLAN